jgi:hypothetical protein
VPRNQPLGQDAAADAIVRHGILHDQVNFLQKPFSPSALTEKVREALTAGASCGAI